MFWGITPVIGRHLGLKKSLIHKVVVLFLTKFFSLPYRFSYRCVYVSLVSRTKGAWFCSKNGLSTSSITATKDFTSFKKEV